MDSILKFFLGFLMAVLNAAFLTTQFLDANPDPAYIAWRKWITLECFLCVQILLMIFVFSSQSWVWILVLVGIPLSVFQLTSIIPAMIRNRLCPILKRMFAFHLSLLILFLILMFLQIYLK